MSGHITRDVYVHLIVTFDSKGCEKLTPEIHLIVTCDSKVGDVRNLFPLDMAQGSRDARSRNLFLELIEDSVVNNHF